MALGHHFAQHREEIKIPKAAQELWCYGYGNTRKDKNIPRPNPLRSLSCFAAPPSIQPQSFLYYTSISCSSPPQIFSISVGKGKKITHEGLFYKTKPGLDLCCTLSTSGRWKGLNVPPHTKQTRSRTKPMFTAHVCTRSPKP